MTVDVALVCRVVGDHSPAVPEKGMGPLFELADTVGAFPPADDPFPAFGLTEPPTAVIDCHVPSEPVYWYWEPVE